MKNAYRVRILSLSLLVGYFRRAALEACISTKTRSLQEYRRRRSDRILCA
ncbi:MAG: hypothetical protein F6K14_28105 [Symploca sp. SIO2C1]|nr:hypothetical protein [Symploca sp. SIO2C1]